jgi:hypothetical protein
LVDDNERLVVLERCSASREDAVVDTSYWRRCRRAVFEPSDPRSQVVVVTAIAGLEKPAGNVVFGFGKLGSEGKGRLPVAVLGIPAN